MSDRYHVRCCNRTSVAGRGVSVPAVLVVEAHDIVLAEITADLNFDQFKWDLARIGEAVDAADWNIGRLFSCTTWISSRR